MSAFSSTTTFIKSTSPIESKRTCAVLKSKRAKDAPPGDPVFANSAIPTTVSYTHLPSPRDRTRSRMPSSA